MRPDTRSFSFTWLKGQQQQRSSSNLNSENEQPSKISTSSLSGGEINGKEKTLEKTVKLKRLGSSLLKGFQTNYLAIQNEVCEENEDLESGTSDKQDFSGTSGSSGSSGASNGISITQRLNKTVQDVKTSLGNISQRLRRSTRRRYRMGANTPEISPTRRILGRTPTKLYSPFGFDSPKVGKPTRRFDRLSTPRLDKQQKRRGGYPYSPSNNFVRDVKDMTKGMEDFQIMSRDITRRSVRF